MGTASFSSTTRWSDGMPTIGRLELVSPTIPVYKARRMGFADRSVLEDRPHFHRVTSPTGHRGLSSCSFPLVRAREVRMARRVRCSNAFSGHPLGWFDWAGDIEAPNTEEREHPGPCSLHGWQQAAKQPSRACRLRRLGAP